MRDEDGQNSESSSADANQMRVQAVIDIETDYAG
jgi:hypothetical protein